MSAHRLRQLSRVQSLSELRVDEALAQLQEQQKRVVALQAKADDIQACAQLLVEQLSSLDALRLHQQKLTVAMLQEEAASRAIVERDLRKEQLYLATAVNDVSDAVAILKQKRAQWCQQSARLDALTVLTQDQQKLALQQVQRLADRDMDDQAISRHGVGSNG